jgi:1,4-dihydroxy-2-naphthoate octaprenyltransferase
MRRKKKMKNKSIGSCLVYSLIGFIMLVVSVILHKLTKNAHGIIYNSSFILFSIGASVLVQNIRNIFNICAIKKDPQLENQKEIDEKDERNIVIRDKAKAKAFDIMVIVFAALILALSLVLVDQTVVYLFTIVYLFVIFLYIYFMDKYDKEM